MTTVSDVSDAAGSAEPLGPSPTEKGVNFAVYSANASEMTLCLFTKDNEPIVELNMTKAGAHPVKMSRASRTCCPALDVLPPVKMQLALSARSA